MLALVLARSKDGDKGTFEIELISGSLTSFASLVESGSIPNSDDEVSEIVPWELDKQQEPECRDHSFAKEIDREHIQDAVYEFVYVV